MWITGWMCDVYERGGGGGMCEWVCVCMYGVYI